MSIHKQALDATKNDNWEEAHTLVQDESEKLSCIIHSYLHSNSHGYLHRVEGDLFNARYWYSRANENMLENSLEEELERLHGLLTDT